MKREFAEAGENLSRAFLQFPSLSRYGRKLCFRPEDGRPGLKPGGVMMLLAIQSELERQGKGPGITETLLSAGTGMKTQSINPILSDLESRGFIRRTTDSEDRRFVLITLTKSGKKALEEIRACYNRNIEKITAYLGVRKCGLLAELLNEVYEYFRREGEGLPKGKQENP